MATDLTRCPGWTGGAFSVLRALLGASLAALFAQHALGEDPRLPFPVVPGSLAWTGAHVGAVLVSLAFAVGWYTRLAAAVLLLLWLSWCAREPFAADPASVPVAALLVACASMRTPPYGSLDARGRTDPAGGFELPSGWTPLGWAAVLLGLFLAAASATPRLLWMSLPLAAVPLAVFGPTRPWLLLALAALQGYLGVTSAAPLAALPFLLALAFLFEPRWIPPYRPADPVERLFYDGTCGLCHRTVRFLLAEDRRGAFRFAALGEETYQRTLPAAQRAGMPDSLVVVTHAGELRVRSDATIHLLLRLGGLWTALGRLLQLIPAPLRNAAYDVVARSRHRLFARPTESCPLLPPELAGRFDP